MHNPRLSLMKLFFCLFFIFFLQQINKLIAKIKYMWLDEFYGNWSLTFLWLFRTVHDFSYAAEGFDQLINWLYLAQVAFSPVSVDIAVRMDEIIHCGCKYPNLKLTSPEVVKKNYIFVIRLFRPRTPSMCSTENDSKNRGYKRSLLSTI